MTDIGGGEMAGGDVGGGGDAAPGEGAGFDNNTPPDGGTGEEPTEGGAAKPKAETPSRYKVKRGGAEQEYDVDEIVKMLSDDYEHEITGPGGKPTKLSWPDIVRRVQLAEGAQGRMEQAAKLRQELEQQREWGREPDNIGAYLETHLGVEDHESWALQIARQAYERDAEIAALAEQDPMSAEQRRMEVAKARFDRQQRWKEAKESRERAAREAAQRKEMGERTAQDAFKEAGIPWNPLTVEMGHKVGKLYSQAGQKISNADIAAEVRKEWHKWINSTLDGYDDDTLPTILGDSLRERLRGIESNIAKGVKKQEREEQKAAETTTQKKKKPQTDAEFARMLRDGEL